MDGFGTAITGSASFNLSRMTAENRTKFLKETFSPTGGFGHSYVRIAIGCSDFSLSEYTCCDTKGIENFALTTEETEYVIPMLKEILSINPGIRIIAAPWTCPRWMKVNNLTELRPYNSWTSGQLNPIYYQDYATYFAKWLQAFKNTGINIYAITPQNEPLNRANSASLYMGWEEQRDFIKILAPTLKTAGVGNVKIYAFDHNYNYDNIAAQQGYPTKIYKDTEASQYIAGAAYHDYGGNREELNIVHNTYPEKELLFTETSIGTWNNGHNLSKALLRDMENVALGTVNNWCKGVIVWNLMLDTNRGPNREGGCRTCYGAVDIDNSNYSSITRNSHYYIISHLAAVVKPDAVRINTSGYNDPSVLYTAFQNPDGSFAFVIINKGSADKPFNITANKRSVSYTLPKYSVTSFLWKNRLTDKE
jgi:glucosylceramidase